jgi:hypothetical protein
MTALHVTQLTAVPEPPGQLADQILAEREEPLQQTALVHHLDAAHVQTERAGLPGRRRLNRQAAPKAVTRRVRRCPRQS